MRQGFTSDIVIVKPNYADDKEKRKYYCKECNDEFCADFKGHSMLKIFTNEFISKKTFI